MTKMVDTPLNGKKPFKNVFNVPDCIETCYEALGTPARHSLYKLWVNCNHFMPRSNLVALEWETWALTRLLNRKR